MQAVTRGGGSSSAQGLGPGAKRASQWRASLPEHWQKVVATEAAEEVASILLSLDAEGSAESVAVLEEAFATSEGVVEPVKEDEAEIDFLGEPTTGNLHLVQREGGEGSSGVHVLGLRHTGDVFDVPLEQLRANQQAMLRSLGLAAAASAGAPQRAIYCSRTLNLRSIQVIGYDMDNTCVNYNVEAWEGRAYSYGMQWLWEAGCPVEGLSIDLDLVTRGLIVDKALGNLLEMDRFGTSSARNTARA
ncbi:hypothetical protein WJX81_007524 [Elliptochloris bilobata]|uniref:5'-nucleotidase n=1 Tax=Elliptochloris bilobata TaxID=381761 RepID=A0AAW1RNF6_9CHLO